MHIRLLGTGAAEGWPALFCRCEPCRQARTLGGRNIRTRASANVDGAFQFDFGPDAYHQALGGNALAAVEHLVFTHAHADHLAPADLAMRRAPFAHGVDTPLQIWGNARVLAAIQRQFPEPARLGLELHELHPFAPTAVGDATLTPLPADHDPQELCLLHLFERGGRRLLYGHDTGVFPEPTWDFLRSWAPDGGRLDVVLLDCTNGPKPGVHNHMGLDGDAQVRRRLLELGAADERTRFIATHFSHNGGLLHEELVELAGPLGLEIAYDGMEVEV